ncbi:MAG TPA: hypothetical protein VL137_13965 [Polyangiaceae bacterium]|nr:hypothetical protein [Polyangiaceae bacterium]
MTASDSGSTLAPAGHNNFGSGGTTTATGGTSAGAFAPGGVPVENPGSSASGGAASGMTAEPPPPPEQEIEKSFQVPVATGRYVWSANPSSGLVAVVDAHSLEVRVLQAGLKPTYLAAVPRDAGHSGAIVINVGSDDATFFDAVEGGGVTSHTLAIQSGANAWAVSKSGHWAIAWTDATQVANLDPTEAFQDIAVLDLSVDPPAVTRLNVGYRPTQIVFDADEQHAYAVTEPSISAISLGSAPQVDRDYEFAGASDQADRDVSITPDGSMALIRVGEIPQLTLLSLQSGEETVLDLPSAVTDLDLASGGASAIAVLRVTSQVALFDIAKAFADPTQVKVLTLADAAAGSVSVSLDGDQAFLFTNAMDSDKLSILSLQDDSARSVSLKAPVRAVFSSPDGAHAIALLQPGVGSSRAGAFAVVPALDRLSPRIQGTDAPPIAVAMVSSPVQRGLITVGNTATGLYGVYVVKLPELQVDFERLLSPPIATGILADEGVGFVAQQHPEGRISFIDLESGTVRTLTGFELGAQVIGG